MAAALVDFRNPRAREILDDRVALGLWEVLRRSSRFMTSDELAAATGVDPNRVRLALEAMSDLGIVDRKGRSRAHPKPRFAVGASHLGVHGEPDDACRPSDFAARHLGGIAAEAFDPVTPSPRGAGDRSRVEVLSVVRLERSELTEFRRRLDLLLQFVKQLGEKRLGPASTPETTLCGHLVRVQVAALARPVLPLPTVHAGAGRTGAPPASGLSRREYEVALGLARGLTRREVAAELGLSPGTVVTLAKRLYRKLSVSRRAQIPDRLREVAPAAGVR